MVRARPSPGRTRTDDPVTFLVLAPLRAALASAAGLSLAACSLITSISGLEATNGPSALGEGDGAAGVDAPTVDTSALGLPAADSSTNGAPTADSSANGAPTVDASMAGPSATDATTGGSSVLDSSVLDAASSPDGLAVPGDSMPADSQAGCSPDLASDPTNCGGCGHDCQGGACSQGMCGPVTLAVTHSGLGIAIDSTFVYFADNDAGVLYKISKALTRQGTPTPVISGAAAQSVQGIASDGVYVYWTNKTNAGEVRRALPTGAGLTTLASNQAQPDWIASNGAVVVWTDQASNQVMLAPAAGNGSTAPIQLNVSGENGTVLAGIAVDDSRAYYATKTSGGGLAESVPLDGGPVTELGIATYVDIAVDNQNVYWTGGSTNPSLYENAKDGSASTEMALAAGALQCPLGVASDGTSVYFLDQGTATCGPASSDAGALYRVSLGSGTTKPSLLVSGLSDPQAIAVDNTAVYWIAGGASGAVMKLAK